MKHTEKRVTTCPFPNPLPAWNQNISKLQVNFKWPNTYIIGVPAGGRGWEGRKKEKYIWRNNGWRISIFWPKVIPEIQEAQQTPSIRNTNKTALWHILSKTWCDKTSDKEQNLKRIYRGKMFLKMMTADFLLEAIEMRQQWNIFTVLKKPISWIQLIFWKLFTVKTIQQIKSGYPMMKSYLCAICQNTFISHYPQRRGTITHQSSSIAFTSPLIPISVLSFPVLSLFFN